MQFTSQPPLRGQAEASTSGRRMAYSARMHVLVPALDVQRALLARRLVARIAEETRPQTTTNHEPVRIQGVKARGSRVTDSMDYDLLYSTSLDCPLGGVETVMRANSRGVLTCSPGETLESIVPRLSKVTGLPVLSTGGKVVGVISRKDIIRHRKKQGSLLDTVEAHMTTPAITIRETASVQEAADLMLSKRIRRLPVVNAEGYPLGILARSDIFKPLFIDQYTEYMEMEVAAMQGVRVAPGSPPPAPVLVVKKQKKKITWAVKYLYDGDCAMCQSLKKVLERQDNGRGKIKFVNIAADDYNPSKNMGIEYEEAMETIHAIRPDGEVLYGTDALRAMFSEVGLGWAANLSESPILAGLVDLIYKFLSANRLSLGGAMDAIIAAKRVEMSKAGVETCSDVDEECKVEW